MIQLTASSGNPIWVNPQYIASISQYSGGSIIGIANDVNGTIVREKPETIIQKISVCQKH